MWEITITCRDGSRLRFSDQRDGAPLKGDIFDTADTGQIIKAKIDTCRVEKPNGWAIPFFTSRRPKYKVVKATPRRFRPSWTVTKPPEASAVAASTLRTSRISGAPKGLHLGIQPVFAQKSPPVTVCLLAAMCPAIGDGAREHSRQDRSDNPVCCDLPGQRRNRLCLRTHLRPCPSGSVAMSRNALNQGRAV
jgi:hypothetical protein